MHVFEKNDKYVGLDKEFHPSCQPLKNNYKFIKYNPTIKRFTGCDRATLILEKIEFFFSKQPNGFYKFIEPCSHRLYKKNDSWSEELGCDRKCFTRSWEKIAFRHKSRRAFNEAIDKFEGKLYASFYDRNRNQMFFIRNHEVANETLKEFYTPKKSKIKKDDTQAKKTSNSLAYEPLRNGHSGRSDMDVKMTPSELFKNNSHASNEIIKKMIEIWTAIVQEGRGDKIELKGKIVPFLRKALADKFNNCLQKWKDYCINIACSKYLMGEKTSWKADLEWSLKFESIRKVLSGNYYGIGDRNRKLTPEELEEKEKQLEEQKKAKELEQQVSLQALEEEIKDSSTEPDSVKNFRIKWLRRFGEKKYRELLADCEMKLGEKETNLTIQPRERIIAIRLESDWNPEFLSGQPFKRVQIYHCVPDVMGKPLIFDRWFGDICDIEEGETIEQGWEGSINPANGFDESPDEKQSAETNQLRASLKAHIPIKPYPVWLDEIKVRTINPDGVLVVTFKDKLASDYARIRFSEGILKSAVELWNEVAGLIIHEESDYLSVQDEDKYSGIDEKTLEEQAIQSLIGAGFSGAGQKGGILNDWIPY
jgi:hypothetical protein